MPDSQEPENRGSAPAPDEETAGGPAGKPAWTFVNPSEAPAEGTASSGTHDEVTAPVAVVVSAPDVASASGAPDVPPAPVTDTSDIAPATGASRSWWLDNLERHPAVALTLVGVLALALVLANVVHLSKKAPVHSHASRAAATSVPDRPAAAPSPTTTVPLAATPPVVIPIVSGPATAAASGTATSPTRTASATVTTVAPVSAAPIGTSPPGPCTPGDLIINTKTDSSSYSPGAPVTATTEIVDYTTCVFDPVPSGPYSCPATVVFGNGAGQTYPAAGQREQCADIGGGTLAPGSTRSVTVVWPQQASTGQYRAIGSWSWSDGSGTPYSANSVSAPYTIS